MEHFKERGLDQGPPKKDLERRFDNIIELYKRCEIGSVREIIDNYNNITSKWDFFSYLLQTIELSDGEGDVDHKLGLKIALEYIHDSQPDYKIGDLVTYRLDGKEVGPFPIQSIEITLFNDDRQVSYNLSNHGAFKTKFAEELSFYKGESSESGGI